MAVAQSGSAVNSSAVNAQTNTLSVTVGSGEALFVALAWYQGSGASITSVVWDPTGVNQALTRVGLMQTDGVDGFSTIYAIGSPTAKTANVVATFVNENTYSVMSATKWTGVDGTTPYHDAATNKGETATSTVNVLNVATGEAVLDAHYIRHGDQDTPGADQDLLCGVPLLGTADNYVAASSVDPDHTGTVTMSWGQTEDAYWAVVACAIKVGSAASSTRVPFRRMNILLRLCLSVSTLFGRLFR